MEKIACYGVRDYEMPVFNELAQKYNYDLDLFKEYLTDDNFSLAYGYEVIMIRGNCFLHADSLTKLYQQGLRIILTRTVGYDHIDLGAAKELGIKVAYAPNYSPNAVAELSVTLALSFLRNIPYLLEQEKEKNFIVDEQMFAKEIRECTVGILGCGNIGMTSAKLFKALGAKVIGYDKNKFTSNDVISYVDFETLLEESDIISIHLNYIKGQNDHLIDAKAITKMKSNCIIINTSRSEVLNYEAVIHALENNELKGLAADVIPQESQLFFQDLKGKEITNPIHQKLLGLFPKVIVTPHIGSSTMTALYNSIDMSLHNLQEIRSGKCSNLL